MLQKITSELHNSNYKALEHNANNDSQIAAIVSKISSLTPQGIHEFILQLKSILYDKPCSPSPQIYVLRLVKSLLLTGSFCIYMMISIHLLPWFKSINGFHGQKELAFRAQALIKQRESLHPGITKDPKIGKQYIILLQFAQQTLNWFGNVIKHQPFSKFKTRSTFNRTLAMIPAVKTQYKYFTKEDQAIYRNNFTSETEDFSIKIKDFLDFVNDLTQSAVVNKNIRGINEHLLISLISTTDSYSINCIIYRLSKLMDQKNVMVTCEILENIMKNGQIEATEQIKIKCLPKVIEHVIPIDFQNSQILQEGKHPINKKNETQIIDYVNLWREMTLNTQLSTDLYDLALQRLKEVKKPVKIIYQNEIKEQIANLDLMKDSNQRKRPYISQIDKQKELINLFRDFSFLSNPPNRNSLQTISSNITLTDHLIYETESINKKQKSKMSGFSQSLMNYSPRGMIRDSQVSVTNSINSSEYQGPSKKFSKVGSKISSESGLKQSFSNLESKAQPVRSSLYHKLNEEMKEPSKYYYEAQHSENIIQEKNPKSIAGQNSLTSIVKDMSNDSLNYTSERHFKTGQIEKPRERMNEKSESLNDGSLKSQNDSGSIVYFDASTIHINKTERSHWDHAIQSENGSKLSSQISFQDSICQKSKLDQDNSRIIEYGTNANAKIPETLKKPKFNFKAVETQQSSQILKDLQEKIIEEEPVVRDHPPQNIFNCQEIDSDSQINQYSHQISMRQSKSNSQLSQAPSKFGSVFKKKSKEKASLISPGKFFKKDKQNSDFFQKNVSVVNLQKLKQLQNELGKLKLENDEYGTALIQKQYEVRRLKIEKQMLDENNGEAIRRQNEIMMALLQAKPGSEKYPVAYKSSSARQLSNYIKSSYMKNLQGSIKEMQAAEPQKLIIEDVEPYSKLFKKQILSGRCLIMNNQFVQVGYAIKGKSIGIYLTLKQHCEQLELKLISNSIAYSDQIHKTFDQFQIGKQKKFKTEFISVNDDKKFKFSQIYVRIQRQMKLQSKNLQFTTDIPLSAYNIAMPIRPTEAIDKNAIAYKTQYFPSCADLISQSTDYLFELFKLGEMEQECFKTAFEFNNEKVNIRIHLKDRSFCIECLGIPNSNLNFLIQSIIKLLVAGN